MRYFTTHAIASCVSLYRFLFCRLAEVSVSQESVGHRPQFNIPWISYLASLKLSFRAKNTNAQKHNFNGVSTLGMDRGHARQNLCLISPLSLCCRSKSNAAGNNSSTSRNRVSRKIYTSITNTLRLNFFIVLVILCFNLHSIKMENYTLRNYLI